MAEGLTFSGYVETGARATDEGEYEPELNDSYTYHNYHAKVEQSFNEMAGYNIGAFLYKKDYAVLNSLNNDSRVLNAGIFYWLNSAVKLDLDMKYRRKRYENSPDREYNQLMVAPSITWKTEDKSSVTFAAGVNKFNYLTKDDETRKFFKLRGTKILYNDKLILSGGYKQEMTEEAKEKWYSFNLKKTMDLGVKYKILMSWIETISARAEFGKANTKDDDEDVESDYKYWRWNAGTSHKISKDIDTNIKLERVMKDYFVDYYDFEALSLVNTWHIYWLTLELGHKKVSYEAWEQNDYIRNTLGVSARYAKRMDWNARAGVEANQYRYDKKTSDKNRYYLTAGAEKVLTERVRLGVELKWRITDNKNGADKRDAGARVTGEWKY